MKRVAYFVTAYPSYSETFIQNEVKQLEQAGFDVVLCNVSGPNKRQTGSKKEIVNNTFNPYLWLKGWFRRGALIRQKTFKKRLFRALIEKPSSLIKFLYLGLSIDAYCQKLENEGIDFSVLHFLFKASFIGHFISREMKVPYHLRLHTKSTVLPSDLVQDILEGAQSISSISEDAATYYSDTYKLKKDITVIRQSINLEKLLGLQPLKDTHGYRLLAIGRLVEKKGFALLIDAIAILPESVKNTLRLKIYGSGPERSALQKQVESLNLQDQVTLEGVMSHTLLMKELSASHLLIAPSIASEVDEDGIPTVIPEAMALMTPVLTTRVAGIPELITHGTTGYLVEPGNVDALSHQLHELLSDLHKAQRVVNAAFQKVIMEYKTSLAGRIKTIDPTLFE